MQQKIVFSEIIRNILIIIVTTSRVISLEKLSVKETDKFLTLN